MTNWTCTLPPAECPCVCCQLLRCQAELAEARQVARELWRWALWNDGIANAACSCETIEDVEEIRVNCLPEYEEWRSWREGTSHRYPWLKEIRR